MKSSESGEAVPKIDMSFVIKTRRRPTSSAGSILLRDVFTVPMLGEHDRMSTASLSYRRRNSSSWDPRRGERGGYSRSYPLASSRTRPLCLARSRVPVSQMFIALTSQTQFPGTQKSWKLFSFFSRSFS